MVYAIWYTRYRRCHSTVSVTCVKGNVSRVMVYLAAKVHKAVVG